MVKNKALPLSYRGMLTSILLLGLLSATPAHGQTQPPLVVPEVFTKKEPESIKDLQEIEQHVQRVVQRTMPAVVGVRNGAGQGSGVIISEDGYVLTAAHVAGPPNRPVTIILSNGKRVNGVTLGSNKKVDAGLIKITKKGKYPFLEMGNSRKLEPGDWCIALGHPGGFRSDRTAPVRLGRIQDNMDELIRTDCTLVGGDSGGPLLDMEGKVIGIHSRIGPSITYNIHVPVDQYRDSWDSLVAGESWSGGRSAAWLGVVGDTNAKVCKLLEVNPNSPAEKAGLQVDDIVLAFNGKAIGGFRDLVAEVEKCRPRQRVTIEVLRGNEPIELQVTLGRKSEENGE